MAGSAPLAPMILASLRIPPAAAPATAALLKALAGQALEATLEATGPDGIHLRLASGKMLVAEGDLPFPVGSALALKALALPQGAGLRLQVVRATPPPAPALLHPLAQGEAAPLLARLQNPAAALEPLALLFHTLGLAGAEHPEAWDSWLKAGMHALADPAASPAEAAFHRLQAKEGTAWFELPLPWAPGAEPLRLWIEADDAAGGEGRDPVHRVFLSVPFTVLGEVRLGLEHRASGLRARIWLRDPDQLAAHRSGLEAALATLGRPVQLQVLPLPADAPDLRALAGGQSLSALG